MSDAEHRDDDPPSLGLGLDMPAQPAAAGGGYRVLARKYRPATFDDLIGQDAMVRTLSNAFETGRIPQAWILTGVRGVGKTTTARILARALNYDAPGVAGPTIQMPELGRHCQAIMESRHVDVIEMDAASHNSVDDIRQINDAVRYAPASARYKVYILDEVHMVTTQGFNALLKTLEEPPPHVKFLFATTDIRKVPITVLSRCQRFDLRRVESGLLVSHLAGICAKEAVEAEPEALALIARAAEGSVRDSLSLLDQAIAHAAGPVRAEDVRQMLGLADRTRIVDLFEALMRGDAASALTELRDQYDSGADPAIVLTDLADFTHFATRIKVVPSVANDPSIPESERTRGRELAAALSMRVLSQTWQMLLRGIAEVQSAPKPLPAAEMVLVRIAYAADLPAPEDVIRSLDKSGRDQGPGAGTSAAGASGNGSPRPSLSAVPAARAEAARTEAARGPARSALARSEPAPPQAQPAGEATPSRTVAKFEELIALADAQRDLNARTALERDVRLVRFEDGRLEIALEAGAPKSLVNDLSRKLALWTGRPWMIVLSSEQGAPTLKAQAEARREQLQHGVQADPLVQAVLSRFPGAEIVGVHLRGEALGGIEPDPPLGMPLEDETDDDL
jgi:DNA polymerase III subunit gamma/tau